MSPRFCLLVAAIALAAAVIFGAFGAHALKGRLTSDLFAIYETAVQYHFWHALGLLAVALLMLHFPEASLLAWTAWLLIIGLIVFSGSLYALAFTGQRWLGAVTPIGGVAFIAAWLTLAWFAWRR
jgi:uncharacterized membrane protein YgdD (TMEM256/DUF423 family)